MKPYKQTLYNVGTLNDWVDVEPCITIKLHFFYGKRTSLHYIMETRNNLINMLL